MVLVSEVLSGWIAYTMKLRRKIRVYKNDGAADEDNAGKTESFITGQVNPTYDLGGVG
jgi:hypothetical protein